MYLCAYCYGARSVCLLLLYGVCVSRSKYGVYLLCLLLYASRVLQCLMLCGTVTSVCVCVCVCVHACVRACVRVCVLLMCVHYLLLFSSDFLFIVPVKL